MRPDGRFTRMQRAELLGVSMVTAARILARSGNDKSVLIDAFRALGITWRDEFCELIPFEADAKSPPPEPTLTPHQRWTPGRAPTIAMALAIVLGGSLLLRGSRSPQSPHDLLNQRLDRSREAFRKADFETAESYAASSVKLARNGSVADKLADSLSLQGDILAAKGRLEEAVVCYKKALPVWSVLEKDHGYGSLLESLGIAEARLGRLADAKSHFQEALRHRRGINDPGVEAGLLRDLGSLAAVQGDLETARKRYVEAKQVIADRPTEAMHTDIKALTALLDRDEGQYDRALAHLQECLDDWKKRGHERWMATTLFQMATVYATAGHDSLAGQYGDRARLLFEKVGDLKGARDCRNWLTPKFQLSDIGRRREEFF